MKGRPVTLAGALPRVGDPAPDFSAIGNDLKEVRLSDYRGKPLIIASVPSLDTAVCDIETRRFNKAAIELAGNAAVLTVSMDLPFAQKRWCGATGVEQVVTLSDHRNADFGNAYGVLLPELRLLARAVFVVDPKGRIQHVELVPEIGSEPDYAAALAALKKSM